MTEEKTAEPVEESYGEQRNVATYQYTEGEYSGQPVEEKIGKEVTGMRKSESDGFVPKEGSSDFERLAVAKALGIENIANKGAFQDQTERIIQWARLSGAKTTTEIVSKIHELSSVVGGGGRNNLYNLSVYAGLKIQEAELQKQLKSYKVK